MESWIRLENDDRESPKADFGEYSYMYTGNLASSWEKRDVGGGAGGQW